MLADRTWKFPAVATSAFSVRTRRFRTIGAASAVVLAVSLSAVPEARAQSPCPATGGLAALTGLIPTLGSFAAGSAASANSLISTIGTVDTAFLAQGQSAFVGSPKSNISDFNAGGVWTRGIGGQVNETSTGTISNVSASVSNPTGLTPTGSPIPLASSGNVACNTRVHESYAGVQVGWDIAKLNLGGSGENVHFGVTAGYAGSNASDNFGGSGSLQAPFAGVYEVLTYGNFFSSIQTQFNFFQLANTQGAININGQNIDAQGFTVSGSAGYKVDLGRNWFIEPSGSIIYSRTSVDTLSYAGTLTSAVGVGGVPPGFFKFNDIESTLGRLGARIGTSFTAGGWALQPFVGASVWHEFEGPATGNFATNCGTTLNCVSSINPAGVNVNGSFSSTRVGTYGDYSAGLATQLADTGWLGYVRVDFLDGQFINGWGLNGGVRYQVDPIAAAPGVYKDKAPVYRGPVAAPYLWTGVYGGAILGAGFGQTKWTFTGPLPTTTLPGVNGILGGGDLGYNYQIGSWVVGVEADVVGTNANGAQGCPDSFFFTCHNNVNTLVTGTGRVGYAWDRTLFFVKGGGAWMDGSVSTSCNTQPGFLFNCNTPGQNIGESRVGWTVGGGLEYGLTQHWSAKAEYDFLDFGTASFTLPAAGGLAPIPFQVRETFSEVKIGVNYRFGPVSDVARF